MTSMYSFLQILHKGKTIFSFLSFLRQGALVGANVKKALLLNSAVACQLFFISDFGQSRPPRIIVGS